MTPEQVLAELTPIAGRLSELDANSPECAALEARRADQRNAAQDAGTATRSRKALESELAQLERRLAGFEGEKISVPAWQMAMSSGGRLTVNDPAALAVKLNDAIDRANRLDREAVAARIEHLEKAPTG